MALGVVAPALSAQHRGGRGYRGRPSASRLHGHRVRGYAPSLAAPRRRPSSPRRPLGPAQGPAAELPPARDARSARQASVQRRGPARVHAADGAPARLATTRDRPPNPAQLRRGRHASEHAVADDGGGRGEGSRGAPRLRHAASGLTSRGPGQDDLSGLIRLWRRRSARGESRTRTGSPPEDFEARPSVRPRHPTAGPVVRFAAITGWRKSEVLGGPEAEDRLPAGITSRPAPSGPAAAAASPGRGPEAAVRTPTDGPGARRG